MQPFPAHANRDSFPSLDFDDLSENTYHSQVERFMQICHRVIYTTTNSQLIEMAQIPLVRPTIRSAASRTSWPGNRE